MPIDITIFTSYEPLPTNEFITFPSGSIGLGGFVDAPTQWNPRFACFSCVDPDWKPGEHPTEIHALTTALQSRMMQTIKCPSEHQQPHVYFFEATMNIVLSLGLLQAFSMPKKSEKLMQRLLEYAALEDKRQIFGGAFPQHVPSKLIQEMAWIMEPHSLIASSERGLSSLRAKDWDELVQQLVRRLRQALNIGFFQKREKWPEMHRIYHQNSFWVMIQNWPSPLSLSRLREDGIHSQVTFKERPDGRFDYSMSSLSGSNRTAPSLPFSNLLPLLNEKEAEKRGDRYPPPKIAAWGSLSWWGGNTTYGRGPRHGSRLNPDEIIQLIERGRRDVGKHLSLLPQRRHLEVVR